jgi:hypothetical protein
MMPPSIALIDQELNRQATFSGLMRSTRALRAFSAPHRSTARWALSQIPANC